MQKIELHNGLCIFNSNVSDGNMSYKYSKEKNEVDQNKLRFYKAINLNPDNIYTLCPTDSDNIQLINSFPNEEKIFADSIITKLANFYIALGFGDCIPLVIYDEKKGYFSFSHLGWKSICEDLHIKVVEKMNFELSCNFSDLMVYVGPSIKQSSYAFEKPEQLALTQWQPYLAYKKGLYHIDLVGFIIGNLINYGISHDNITISSIDTGSNDEFFSHYRSSHDKWSEEGRFIFGVGKKSFT